jgi:DNA-binding transcriptional regulator GbsR (MarR family)
MKFKEILTKLGENFDLKKNHLVILNLLYHQDSLTADDIVAKTGIPKGGIYEYLNDLLHLQLISKDNINPARYDIKNFKSKIVEFLHLQFKEFVQKEAEILNLIERADNFEFKMIRSKEEYTFHLMDIVNGGDAINFIIREKSVPFELYPDNEKDFIAFREKLWKKRPTLSGAENPNLSLMQLKTFQEAWRKKKKLRYIITKSGLEYFFDTLEKDVQIKSREEMTYEIIHRLHKNNIKIKVIDEKTPYNLFISENKIMFVVAKSSKIITGFISNNPEVIMIYQNMFESMYNRTQPIEPIEKYLENKK